MIDGRTACALVLVAAACTSSAPVATTPAPATAAPKPNPEYTNAAPTGGEWYVGVLGAIGEADCPANVQIWVNVEPTIGWARTGPLSDEEAKWMDRPVVAHGHAIAAPPRGKVPLVNECPPMQMRNDWVSTPRGMRISRGGGGGRAEYFERDALRPLGELTATSSAEQLVIELRNPVPTALTDVSIRVHYEGCMGKPGTTHREHAVGDLAVAAGVSAKFDRLVMAADPRGAHGSASHRAFSVQVIAKADDATFDLDVPLAALGAEVECPGR